MFQTYLFLKQNKCSIREVYLMEAKPVGPRQAGTVDQNDPETVVEIQLPV
jgi:hypothetical protein